MKQLLVLICIAFVNIECLVAENHWHTHFSYNSVQLIAMDSSEVYALANGKLFSINQQTEALTLFTNFSGLHGTEIVHIAYDESHCQLLILYADGKMDILCNHKVKYVPDLYNKQMTSSKICNNITFHGNIAYLSMDFGILTFDLVEHKFVDCYYIGPEAKDMRITDVMLHGDSIYAQTLTTNYSALIEDNIIDFRYWNECKTLPCEFDKKKGKEYTDQYGGVWEVAGNKGVSRTFLTNEHVYYLPDGPCVNIPYHIEFAHNKLYMVSGGRWAVQENKPGNIMIYENGQWTNITNGHIEEQTKKKALDFTDVAADLQDPSHFFVSSYGTGLYEFRNNQLYAHHTTENSILGSAVATRPDHYTRLESIVYDSENRMWGCVNGEVDTTFVCFLPDGLQRGLNIQIDSLNRFIIHTSSSLVVDSKHPEKKWIISCRSIPAVVQIDDGGTPFYAQDDQSKVQSEFYDQDGNLIIPDFFYTLAQAPNGDIWVGSSSGPIILPESSDFLHTNECLRLRIVMEDGSNYLDTERINAFAWDNENHIWIGTHSAGVYVLNEDATEVLEHYTSYNSVMPSNSVISLAYDNVKGQMFIGTGMGLVSYVQETNQDTRVDFSNEEITYGSMYQWQSHAAFTKIEQIVVMGDKAYGLSSNSLFSVNRYNREIEYYTGLNGLSSSVIDHIAYNEQLDRMLITYRNGQIDIMTADGKVHNLSDLYLKQISMPKRVNDICMHKEYAILAMEFGILVVDMKKAEFSDTYYIGKNSSEVSIKYITATSDTIFAATDNEIYFANLADNLKDYAYWQTRSYPSGKINGLRAYKNDLYLLVDQKLYFYDEQTWNSIETNDSPPFRSLCATKNGLFAFPYAKYGVWKIYEEDHSIALYMTYAYSFAIEEDGQAFWLGTEKNGLVRLYKTEEPRYQKNIQENHPEGPLSNYAYRLKFFGDKLYMLPGGRWANQYRRLGDIMIYKDGFWTNIKNSDLVNQTEDKQALRDFMNVAQDPNDENHYFITTYGTGLIEMKEKKLIKIYKPSNSGLFSAIPDNPDFYTRTDGVMYDEQGNLWLLNTGEVKGNIHIVSREGKWNSFSLSSNGKNITLHTPGEILVDNRNSQWKWIPSLRADAGLVLLQDNGTPSNPNDDHVTYRRNWTDQTGRTITPSEIRAIAQDSNHTIWVGTSSGIFAIPHSVDFTISNQCIRIIIPRNDGSGLGDYLLENEQINAIAIDGANRLWVGTTNSGIFLLNPIGDVNNISYYTAETLAHFTTENSILPTDEIMSIAIKESTGEVFIGTGEGLVSYKSDALKPSIDFDSLYAYPNPVPPTFHGHITISGLMDDSEVRIIDASGNLVKQIQGQGGIATWDGKNAEGNRVATGIYTALCNTLSGTSHGFVKILIMN